ncbi:MAG: hypothetical protein H6906_02975 [Hyphomicrobiales bacterium]|nr:hypothetical protein [Hyphomicrobiales bacterium]
MFKHVSAAALILLLAAAPALAGEPFVPIDSGKEIETKVAALLKSRMKLNSALQVVGEDADNLRASTLFNANAEAGTPRVMVLTDTLVLKRDADGKPTSQAIAISAIGDVKLKADEELKLLRWANIWNAKALPVRIYIVSGKVVAATNMVMTRTVSVSEDEFLTAFLNTTQIWALLIKDLEHAGLLADAQ